MSLKDNLQYWYISLHNPEPLIDESYVIDEVIIEDKELLRKVDRLRELITAYCVVIEKDREVAKKLFNEIYEIIMSIDKIQYTEFVAFWKVLDMSYSIFKQMQNNRLLLQELLKKYCSRRRELYDKLGYSNVIVQALYDSGASRKKGNLGTDKVLKLAEEVFGDIQPQGINYIRESTLGYFLPDDVDTETFKQFCSEIGANYDFGKAHQGKKPDIVLKIGKHFFIIEAKHIKESGGAQDKQVVELIEFIRYSEVSEYIHYLSFMDGLYFNKFIIPSSKKVSDQKGDIENLLKQNKSNFFVNTAGIKEVFNDLKNEL